MVLADGCLVSSPLPGTPLPGTLLPAESDIHRTRRHAVDRHAARHGFHRGRHRARGGRRSLFSEMEKEADAHSGPADRPVLAGPAVVVADERHESGIGDHRPGRRRGGGVGVGGGAEAPRCPTTTWCGSARPVLIRWTLCSARYLPRVGWCGSRPRTEPVTELRHRTEPGRRTEHRVSAHHVDDELRRHHHDQHQQCDAMNPVPRFRTSRAPAWAPMTLNTASRMPSSHST